MTDPQPYNPDCICPHAWTSSRDYGKHWSRMSTTTGCTIHDPKAHKFNQIPIDETWMTPSVWIGHCTICGGKQKEH